ncbi:MAG: hypothetical protein CMP16_02195 [Rickettsiales bacterium]|nr:hypothetical protein [Rickettsiales bacterium]|tara:strand:- start:936 stop:1385 length:450 start_codon:yes stop_codon:yes gene_type:complete
MADTSLNEERIGLLIWQASNNWQSNLRKILKKFQISLNEYLILETLVKMDGKFDVISQINISFNSFLDVSVVSTNLKILENKNFIFKSNIDSRTKNIELSSKGLKLVTNLILLIENEEKKLFEKLGSESFNFKNSLKLLLGKKIRIKAK